MSTFVLNPVAATGYTWGGGYVASASSEWGGSYIAWKAFDKLDLDDAWITSSGTYSSSDGTQVRNISTNGYLGEWLQIKLLAPYLLTSFQIRGRWNSETNNPRNFRVFGSTNGTSWTQLVEVLDAPLTAPYASANFNVSTTQAFTYYRIVINQIYPAGKNYGTIGEWILTGMNAPFTVSSSNYGTFYYHASASNFRYIAPKHTFQHFNNDGQFQDVLIVTNGAVGIGTSSFTNNSKLQVAGAITTSNLYYTGTVFKNNDITASWLMNNTSAYYSEGNVGIGTSSPIDKLHIQGNVRLAGVTGTGITDQVNITSSSTVASATAVKTAYDLAVSADNKANASLSTTGGTISGNLTVSGNLTASNVSVLGNVNLVQAYTTQTSNVVINNTQGMGPALSVTQKTVGGNGRIAEFFDFDVSTTNPVFIIADGGNVGIGTSTPSTPLTVVGDVSATRFLGDGSLLTNTPINNIDASNITSGVIQMARLPSFDASNITTGVFNIARIPSLDASNIPSGTFTTSQIPSLDASKITSGTFDAARIPSLSASTITTGVLPSNVLPLSGVTSNIYGSTTTIPQLIIDEIGRVTYASNVPVLASQWTTNGSTITYSNGNVGIGTTTANYTLDVHGTTRFSSNVTIQGTLYASLIDGFQYPTPDRATELISSPKSVFTILISGIHEFTESNVDVYVNGLKLGYISVSQNDYTVSYSQGATTTTVTVTLNQSTSIDDVVEIAVHKPIISEGSSKWDYGSGNSIYYNYGNVGVGTTTPVSSLHVNGIVSSTQGLRILNDNPGVILEKKYTVDTERYGIAQMTSSGSNTTRMYMGSNVTSTINLSMATGADTYQDQLRVNFNGDVQIRNDLAYFAASTMSDARLKENVQSVQNGLDIVHRLHPVHYHWKSDVPSLSRQGAYDVGFIAQEVEPVLPHIIKEIQSMDDSSLTYKCVMYERIVPYLVKAVQELSHAVAELQKQK